MLGMGLAFRIALQAEAHMFKKWEAAHRELGPFVWSGGSIPEFGSKTGYAFPVASLAETASRNELSERDTLSHRGFKRKPCPGIEPQGGTHFPVEAWDGRRVPESG